MEVSNEATAIKKEADVDNEQDNNEIFIKLEPEYVLSRYYNEDDCERVDHEENTKKEEYEDSTTDVLMKNENDETYFDDVSIKTENDDSNHDTVSNVNIKKNNQTEHSGNFGNQIIAWDNKKDGYVYASSASTSRLTLRTKKTTKSSPDGTLEESKRFHCSECEYSTNRKHHIQRHGLVHSKDAKQSANTDKQKRFQCTACSYTTDHSSDIKRHGLKHSKNGREKFVCKHCDYTTYHKYHLLGHMNKLHTSTYSKFSCDYCQKMFKSKQSLDDHNIKCHPSLDFSFSSKILACSNCSFKTALKRSLVRHILLKHPEGNAPTYECETCGHKTLLQSNYILHLRKHADVKPYCCSECGKGFLLKRSLDEHILRVHSENEESMKTMTYRILLCEQCDFRTVKSDVLKSHIANLHQT